MIRTYTVTEVESICGVSRRTISEYVAKGLLAGPSHRGRGARYPQSDVDVLHLLPKFRTLMKREFPNLNALAVFLRQLSIRDLRMLAAKNSESGFVLEVRRLRVRNSLASLAPHVAPERIEATLSSLTPGQIRAVDSGRYQIGAVLDISALLQEHHRPSDANAGNEYSHSGHNGLTNGHLNGYANGHQNGNSAERHEAATAANQPSWSVSWLGEEQSANVSSGGALAPDDIGSLSEVINRIERKAAATSAELEARLNNSNNASDGRRNADFDDTQRDLLALANNDSASTAVAAVNLGQRLTDIAQRLERLESMLER